MSTEAVKTLVQALISCPMDYCNSRFYDITEGLTNRLQSVRNATAHLVSDARRYDQITTVLQELHWLPVRRRVDFKMATLVYLSLSGMAPACPPTASWSPTKFAVGCVLDVCCETNLETDVLQLRFRSCGIALIPADLR